ncbi:flagellar biosynthesis anti-sigma factor FlgM [uncultured Ralstonia sp.]|uniref:flagellar biosynthesis anti-sigma factor FlgM n=1 Tax=Ralstonia sp. TaxID=54061 RepID=UPI0025E34B7B|nr:flagellar biosynthesis anti-sigma factor FlgM [uncultured Ralstonia sp.]
MKINHIVNNSTAVTPAKDAASGSTSAASTSSGSAKAASNAQQSSHSPSLSVQQVSRQVGSGDFDAARVDQIRAAIQNGTLKMDASKIADGVLSDAKSLLSAHTKSA